MNETTIANVADNPATSNLDNLCPKCGFLKDINNCTDDKCYTNKWVNKFLERN